MRCQNIISRTWSKRLTAERNCRFQALPGRIFCRSCENSIAAVLRGGMLRIADLLGTIKKPSSSDYRERKRGIVA